MIASKQEQDASYGGALLRARTAQRYGKLMNGAEEIEPYLSSSGGKYSVACFSLRRILTHPGDETQQQTFFLLPLSSYKKVGSLVSTCLKQ